jgi:ATP-dependent Clp protease protease subunit
MPSCYITIHGNINVANVTRIMAVISEKIMQGRDEFHLLLSTPGGEVAAGITLYNFIRSIPHAVTMYNVGNVDSIGNSIFVAANRRFACQHSTFMFHGVGMFLNAVVEEKQAREALGGILADQARISDILVARTQITSEQAGTFFREARTLTAREALDLGMIEGIQDPQIPPGADIFTIMF